MIALLLGWACTDEIETFISDNPSAPTMTNPADGDVIILEQEAGGENITFSFSPADYGYSAAVNYTVQLAEAGTSFANPLEIGPASGTSISTTQASLNQRLITRGYAADEEILMDVRVKSSVGDAVAPVYSETTTLRITPYAEALTFSRMYVPGDYQGWDPSNENTVIFSVNDDNVFEGFIHIYEGSGAFKVNEQPNWDINYGGASGDLEQNGPDLQISEPFGTFRLTVDLNAMTYAIGTRRVWGIVGDATPGGWDEDTPMSFDASENVLTITADLAQGEMKFRGSNDWGHNYGDDGQDGTLQADGANIAIPEAGNYTITMDWKVPDEISYEIVKN